MGQRDTTLWYSVREYDIDDRYQLTVPWRATIEADSYDLESVAADAAEDYHSNHDGWECSWPLEIALFATEDGPEVGSFNVERETEPVFYARAIKPSGRG